MVAVGVRTYQEHGQLKNHFTWAMHKRSGAGAGIRDSECCGRELVEPSEVAGGCGRRIALCHPS